MSTHVGDMSGRLLARVCDGDWRDMVLVGNGRVITRDPASPYFEHGAVLIDGDKIAGVGDEAALRAANPSAEYVDAHGGVIMPGLVNCHTHIYSGLTSWRTSSSSGGRSTTTSRSTARARAPTPPCWTACATA